MLVMPYYSKGLFNYWLQYCYSISICNDMDQLSQLLLMAKQLNLNLVTPLWGSLLVNATSFAPGARRDACLDADGAP